MDVFPTLRMFPVGGHKGTAAFISQTTFYLSWIKEPWLGIAHYTTAGTTDDISEILNKELEKMDLALNLIKSKSMLFQIQSQTSLQSTAKAVTAGRPMGAS